MFQVRIIRIDMTLVVIYYNWPVLIFSIWTISCNKFGFFKRAESQRELKLITFISFLNQVTFIILLICPWVKLSHNRKDGSVLFLLRWKQLRLWNAIITKLLCKRNFIGLFKLKSNEILLPWQQYNWEKNVKII